MTGGFWRTNGVKNGMRIVATTNFGPFWTTVRRVPRVKSFFNAWIINRLVYTMDTRPEALSTMSDYTSWESLRDRTWSQRHLPPKPALRLGEPPIGKVTDLFRRPDGRVEVSTKSTLLFPLFAQWFVDGFLRTDPKCVKKNTSTHEIDLSQLYGQTEAVTHMLRGRDGLLKHRTDGDGNEFPPYYFKDGDVDPRFKDLPIIYPGDDLQPGEHDLPDDRKAQALKAFGSNSIPDEVKHKLFALGIPRGNIHYGFAMISTLFLREHNRIARRIKAENEGWDDDHVFEATRNTLIVVLLKVVIEDYINHITPIRFPLFVEPGIGAREKWFRQNWMSVEFNLLYRWHTLIPTRVSVGGRDRKFADIWWDTRIVTDNGLAKLFEEASTQPCSTIGLFNTDESMLDIEKTSINIGRDVDLASYNDYRAACGFPKLGSFEDLTSDKGAQAALKECYGEKGIDRLELFVGLFAEDVRKGGTLPTLMSTMVAVDAFSQALTNPLLDPELFNDRTFSRAGMDVIRSTTTLNDIVQRNIAHEKRATPFVSLTREGWRLS